MSEAGWETKSLEELCVFINGLWKGEEPPFIQAGVIRNTNFTKDGKLDDSDIAYLDVEVKKLAKRQLQYGDIILEKSGGGPKQAVGRVIIFDKKSGVYSFSNFTSAIRILDPKKLDFSYLHKFLHWIYISGVTEGIQSNSTGIRNLNGDAYKALKVHYPSITEQQRIVQFLDEAFEAIATAKANAEKNLQNARALFESHLQAVFSQRGEGWDEKPLSELCTIKHGFAFEGEFFSNEGEYVLLTPGNFYETGGYRDRGQKQKYYTGEIPTEYVLNQGDLLLAMTEQAAGLLGSPILVPEANKYLHNQRLGLVFKKPGTPWVNEFFFHVFNTQRVREEIHASASGVKVRHTSPSKIGEVTVTYPTAIEEQRKIGLAMVEYKRETQRLEQIYQSKLSALDSLKKSLLHQAFSGQLTSSLPKNIIPFPTKVPDIAPTDLHAGILAIAYQFHEAKGNLENYGHVKAEKIAHMVEAHLGLDLDRTPVKDAAGPNDYPHSRKVEHRARMAGFFDFHPTETGAYQVKKLPGFEKHILRTREKLGDRVQGVIDLMNLMVGMTTRQAEIFATVYAAWNNLLLEGKPVADEDIVTEARENWHTAKMDIPREKFFKAIGWIRERNLMPKGMGKRVVAKG